MWPTPYEVGSAVVDISNGLESCYHEYDYVYILFHDGTKHRLVKTAPRTKNNDGIFIKNNNTHSNAFINSAANGSIVAWKNNIPKLQAELLSYKLSTGSSLCIQWGPSSQFPMT